MEWMYPKRTFLISQPEWNNNLPFVNVNDSDLKNLLKSEDAGTAFTTSRDRVLWIDFQEESFGGLPVELHGVEVVMTADNGASFCMTLYDVNQEQIGDQVCNNNHRHNVKWKTSSGMQNYKAFMLAKDDLFYDDIVEMNTDPDFDRKIRGEPWEGVASIVFDISIYQSPPTYVGINLYGRGGIAVEGYESVIHSDPVISVPQCEAGEENNPDIVCYAENKAHIENVYTDSFDVVIPFGDTEIFGQNPDVDSIIAKLSDWNVNDEKTAVAKSVKIENYLLAYDVQNDQACASEEVTIMSASDHVMNGAQVYRENQELKVTFELCFNLRPTAVSSDPHNVIEPDVKLITERSLLIDPTYELRIVNNENRTYKIGETVEFEVVNTEGFEFLYQKATSCIVVPDEGTDVYIYGEAEDYCKIPFFGFEVISDDEPLLSKYSYKAFKKLNDKDYMMADESEGDAQFLRCNIKPSLQPVGDVDNVGECQQ